MNEDFRTLKIIFTRHAKGRLNDAQLGFRRVYGMIRNSEVVKLPGMSDYKCAKYGPRSQDGMIYLRNGSYIFTCRVVENNFKPGEMVLLVITATDQRATAGRKGHQFGA